MILCLPLSEIYLLNYLFLFGKKINVCNKNIENNKKEESREHY